jgi:hypothetical protein
MIRVPSHLNCSAVGFVALIAAFCMSALAQTPIAEFRAENMAAMNKMMVGMAVKSSNDVDRDFASMMIPHHQGAIEMAEAELRHGHNDQLRRIAQEIIVDQQQEIAAMRLALGDTLPASVAAPTHPVTATPVPNQRPTVTNLEHQP